MGKMIKKLKTFSIREFYCDSTADAGDFRWKEIILEKTLERKIIEC
jgi:hypothetical protein